MTRAIPFLAIAVLSGCTAGQTASTSTPAALEIEAIAQKYTGYTVERAEREGYRRDAFCLDAAAFGKSTSLGAMGFHATNEALLRGPIDMHRPQALLFDAEGRVLGVEYEIIAGARPEAPQLFGRSFAKLPAHPGVQHEHFALHVWFIENPSGRFADFNPEGELPGGKRSVARSRWTREHDAATGARRGALRGATRMER